MRASAKGYWSDYEWSPTAPYTGLTGSRPCDTAQVWTIADNVQHLVDESHGYKINWVSPLMLGSDPNVLSLGAYPRTSFASQVGPTAIAKMNASLEFPTTIVREGEYPNYDVRLGVWLAAGSMSCRVTMSARSASAGAGVEDPSVLGVLNASTGATAGKWLDLAAAPANIATMNSAISPSDQGRKPSLGGQWYGATPPGGLVRPTQALPLPRDKLMAQSIFVRMEIQCLSTSSGNGDWSDFSIIGLQVKEYPTL